MHASTQTVDGSGRRLEWPCSALCVLRPEHEPRIRTAGTSGPSRSIARPSPGVHRGRRCRVHPITSHSGRRHAREVMVRFAAGLSDAEIAAEVARLGADVLRVLPGLRLYRLRIPANVPVVDFLTAQQGNSAIQRIEANPRVRAFQMADSPNDPYFESQWGLQRTGAPAGAAVTLRRLGGGRRGGPHGEIMHPDLQEAACRVQVPHPGEEFPELDDEASWTWPTAGTTGAYLQYRHRCVRSRSGPSENCMQWAWHSCSRIGVLYAWSHGELTINLKFFCGTVELSLRRPMTIAVNGGTR